MVAIEQSKNLHTMKLEELQGSLEANEVRLKERVIDKEKATEKSLQAKFNKESGDWKKKGKGNWNN